MESQKTFFVKRWRVLLVWSYSSAVVVVEAFVELYVSRDLAMKGLPNEKLW